MSFSTTLQAVINVITPVDYRMAKRINALSTDYPTLIEALLSYNQIYDCDAGTFLNDILDCFATADLTANGVRYNINTPLVTVLNPRLVARCHYEGIILSTGARVESLVIYDSTINILLLDNGTQLDTLTVAKASTLNTINVTSPAYITTLGIYACSANISTVHKVAYDATVKNIFVEQNGVDGGNANAVFGGIEDVPIIVV